MKSLERQKKGTSIFMEIFERIKTIGKTAYIANIGGKRPDIHDMNWFGGNF